MVSDPFAAWVVEGLVPCFYVVVVDPSCFQTGVQALAPALHGGYWGEVSGMRGYRYKSHSPSVSFRWKELPLESLAGRGISPSIRTAS